MSALTARASLVDPATLGDGEGVIATSIPRSEIEEALEAGTTSELFLDVARERDGEREAEQRITVSWEPADLQKLLTSTTGDEVTFAFRPDELARMFDESDVEAHGLREKMAILTVAATTAAGISAGVASGMVANPIGEGGGGGATTAAFVTDTTSSGPAAEAGTVSNLVTDTTSSAGSAQEGLTPAQQLNQLEADATSGQFLTDATSSGPQATDEAGTVSNLVTDTTSSAGSAQEGLTPAQQLNQLEADATSGQFLTDATSSGPQATDEAGTVSNLVTDTTSSAGSAQEGLTPAQQLNQLEADATSGQFLTDATSSGPQASTGGQFLTDATSSGPQATTEAATASGGGGQSFIESRGGEAALAGGLVLLILGAGFIGTRQRRGVQPA
jgi:hypothetical protein